MKPTQTLAQSSDRPMPWEAEHLKLACRAALESIVLLENDGALPLKPGKVALFGAGAEYTIQGGTGSGEVNCRKSYSIREGLEQAGFTITTDSWLQTYTRHYQDAQVEYAEALRKRIKKLQIGQIANLMKNPFTAPPGQPITEADVEQAQCDTCIYVIARQAGEGADRRLDQDYCLSPEEREHIAFCAKAFEKTILVINVGGVFDLRFLDEIEGINALVFYGQQGVMGGPALAAILAGRVCPSGRLTASWPMAYEDIPCAMDYSYLNGDARQEYYREGIYVGYRWFDSKGIAPRYPFGYGLSYTRFSLNYGQLSLENEMLQLTVQVENKGSVRGKQVVQLYAACPQTPELPKEAKRLVAFGKTEELLPGESQELTLRFLPRELASYREVDNITLLEKGDYVLLAGTSAADVEAVAVVRVEREQVLSRHRGLCRPGLPVGELEPPLVEQQPAAGPVVVLPQQPCREHDYTEPAIKPLGLELNKKQMAQLCVGGGLFRQRLVDAPGAAGVTTDKLNKLGIPQRVMADGPAGLRLQKQTVRLKNGKLKPVEPPMEFMKYLPKFVLKYLCADPQKGRLLYQYATAFPGALAMAQSWNGALLEEMGQAVGREMESYGVHFWLAPALNLHRNPLCGRNFEYYSEDPLLSGKLAAAVTRGVQSVPGRFVTLKHFACNNQEDDRNRTCAHVKQRALRELYLKGFEIAVREGAPGAVMTSYNQLAGSYTANNWELITGILRCEWGFDGLVMTDWLATGRGLADDGRCIRAGNDLIMPGSSRKVRAILRALRRGEITQEDLRRCAGNVLAAIRKCETQE